MSGRFLKAETQLFQQTRTQNRIAILGPLALGNSNHHPLALNTAQPEMARFVEPQSGAVNGHEKGPMLRVGTALLQEHLHLRQTIDAHALLRLLVARQSTLHLSDATIQNIAVKKAQPADSHIQTAGRKLALVVKIQQVILDLFIHNPLRRTLVIAGQSLHRCDVCLVSPQR